MRRGLCKCEVDDVSAALGSATGLHCDSPVTLRKRSEPGWRPRVKGGRGVKGYIARVHWRQKGQENSGGFDPCGFGRLFCLSDEIADRAHSRLKHPKRIVREPLQSLVPVVLWQLSNRTTNTNRQHSLRKVDEVPAAGDEVESLTQS